jgi:hypothetical protein
MEMLFLSAHTLSRAPCRYCNWPENEDYEGPEATNVMALIPSFMTSSQFAQKSVVEGEASLPLWNQNVGYKHDSVH